MERFNQEKEMKYMTKKQLFSILFMLIFMFCTLPVTASAETGDTHSHFPCGDKNCTHGVCGGIHADYGTGSSNNNGSYS